jgi:hypothetical protein
MIHPLDSADAVIAYHVSYQNAPNGRQLEEGASRMVKKAAQAVIRQG